MSRLFGTDGVRGKAGEHPLDHETVARLGAALVRAMRHAESPVAIGSGHPEPGRGMRFIVGRDTRESGVWIEQELARGIRSEGAQLTSGGVIPTPAVAYVAREMDFDAVFVSNFLEHLVRYSSDRTKST